MRFDAANTYSGPTVIGAGILTVGINNAVPSGSEVTVNGTLNLNGYTDTIASLSGSGTMTLGGGTLIIGTTIGRQLLRTHQRGGQSGQGRRAWVTISGTIAVRHGNGQQ